MWLKPPCRLTLWEESGFLRVGHCEKVGNWATCDGHKLDSFLLNVPMVPWAGETSEGVGG